MSKEFRTPNVVVTTQMHANHWNSEIVGASLSSWSEIWVSSWAKNREPSQRTDVALCGKDGDCLTTQVPKRVLDSAAWRCKFNSAHVQGLQVHQSCIRLLDSLIFLVLCFNLWKNSTQLPGTWSCESIRYKCTFYYSTSLHLWRCSRNSRQRSTFGNWCSQWGCRLLPCRNYVLVKWLAPLWQLPHVWVIFYFIIVFRR